MEILKCLLCERLRLKMRSLPCDHMFCVRCLRRHIRQTIQAEGSDSFHCPKCDTEIEPVNPSHHFNQWAEDFPCEKQYLEVILLLRQLQKQLSNKNCDSCLNSKDVFRENHAEGWCQPCGCFLCMACWRLHHYTHKKSNQTMLLRRSDPLVIIQAYIKNRRESVRRRRTTLFDLIINQKKKLENNLADRYAEVCCQLQSHFVRITEALENLNFSVSNLQNCLSSLQPNDQLCLLIQHVKHTWIEMNKNYDLKDDFLFRLESNSNFETLFNKVITFSLGDMTPPSEETNQQNPNKRKSDSEDFTSPNKIPSISTSSTNPSTSENYSLKSANSTEESPFDLDLQDDTKEQLNISNSSPKSSNWNEDPTFVSDFLQDKNEELKTSNSFEETLHLSDESSSADVNSIRIFSANIEDEKALCSPSSLIILPTNPYELVIADYNNYSIKKFRLDGKLRYRLRFPHAPTDMTLLSKHKFAVTIPDMKTISIVKSKSKLREVQTIETIRPYQNLASAFKGSILLCVFRSSVLELNSIQSGIDLISGVDFTTLKTFTDPLNYPNPGNIALGTMGSIYVADLTENHSRVCRIFMEPTNTWEGRTHCRLKHLSSLCTDRFGYIYVTDMQANRIYRLTPDLKFDGFLLSKNDGLKLPEVIKVHEKLLIVAEMKGYVKIFQFP